MAKKKKPIDNTEKALTAFDIAAELQTITQKIIDQEGELVEGDMEALQSWQAALEDKAENIGHVKQRLESEAAYFKAVEDAASARRKAREGAICRLRKYLAIVMGQAGVKSIKKNDGLFSVSLCEGKTAVRIENENILPVDLVEIVEVTRPKTAEIKARIESGEDVPGATVERGESYVTIR